uniref:Uncharacterized protein n=1 Tax=Glossina pallidipes TaxID=7398 RepID=A0A1A9ZHR7_GLOPL
MTPTSDGLSQPDLLEVKQINDTINKRNYFGITFYIVVVNFPVLMESISFSQKYFSVKEDCDFCIKWSALQFVLQRLPRFPRGRNHTRVSSVCSTASKINTFNGNIKSIDAAIYDAVDDVILCSLASENKNRRNNSLTIFCFFEALEILVWQFLSKLKSSQCAGAEVEKIKINLHSKNVTSSNVTVNLVRSNQRTQGTKNRADTDSGERATFKPRCARSQRIAIERGGLFKGLKFSCPADPDVIPSRAISEISHKVLNFVSYGAQLSRNSIGIHIRHTFPYMPLGPAQNWAILWCRDK